MARELPISKGHFEKSATKVGIKDVNFVFFEIWRIICIPLQMKNDMTLHIVEFLG